MRDFIENAPEPTLLAASHEIDRLVDTPMTDAEVGKVLESTGLKAGPRYDDGSLRPWLAWVKEGIWKELNRRAAEGGLPPEEWEDEGE